MVSAVVVLVSWVIQNDAVLSKYDSLINLFRIIRARPQAFVFFIANLKYFVAVRCQVIVPTDVLLVVDKDNLNQTACFSSDVFLPYYTAWLYAVYFLFVLSFRTHRYPPFVAMVTCCEAVQ